MTSLSVGALAYLAGSIPFSYLVARVFGVRDVRQEGSGNVGATNVLRTAGRTAGVLALALDALKGVVPVLAAARLEPPGYQPELAAVMAVLGHMFPVWLGFRGGKGVATGAGAFLALAPTASLLALAVFLVTAGISRFVSLGSVVAAASLPFAMWLLGAPALSCLAAGAVAALIIARHHENLRRLIQGREHRVGTPRP